MTSKGEEFRLERKRAIDGMSRDEELRRMTRAWFDRSCTHGYSYNFTWMGRPIIQYPQDIVALQEIIFRVQPDLIVETGIAHGGSLVLYASLLELLGGDREVVGIDVEIRPHNREALEAHPLFRRMHLIEGSSIDPAIAGRVCERARLRSRVLVVLDSNHTHAHVARELELYSPLVAPGSYLVVCDTVIEDMPADAFPNRPWGRGNNPRTAVREFLRKNDRFEVDAELEAKLLITVAPEGYLRCVR